MGVFDRNEDPTDPEAIFRRRCKKIVTIYGQSQERVEQEAKDFGITAVRENGHWLFTQGEWAATVDLNPKSDNPIELTPYKGLLPSDKFVEAYRPADYLIDGIMQRGYVYALTGFTGHGKTTVTLRMAHDMDHGGFFGEPENEIGKGAVIFLAGENTENVRLQWMALNAFHKTDPAKGNVYWHDGRFDLNRDFDKLRNDISKVKNVQLIVVDTLQAFFVGDNDNDNIQMMKMAQALRKVAELPSKPVVLIACHPSGKTFDKKNLIPRGGGAFMNEIDGNFTVWSDVDGNLEFSTQGKHRGAYFQPVTFQLEEKDFEELADSKGRPTRLQIARPMMTTERMLRVETRARVDVDVLLFIQQCESGTMVATYRSLADNVNGVTSKWKAEQILKDLVKDKLVERKARKWQLKTDGQTVIEDYHEGRINVLE